MQCNFCPNKRGILKRVVFNTAETIWVHPKGRSCTQSARRGLSPSSSKKTGEAFTTFRNTRPNRPAASGSTSKTNSMRPARSATTVRATKSKYKSSDAVHVLHVPKVLPQQLCQIQRLHPRPRVYAVAPLRFSFENCDTYIPPYC